MMRWVVRAGVSAAMWAAAVAAVAQISVPSAPAATAAPHSFVDKRYGVRFEAPAGWTLARRDGEVSNFRLDVRGAPPTSLVRGVASLDFNPFPHSTLSGALLYFSVQPRTDEQACAAEATASGGEEKLRSEALAIGGMGFTHGHREQGTACVEVRDDVYTAYRRHACYRFDLEVNTFCSGPSGAKEISAAELHAVEAQMAGMLSTVSFTWEKTGAQTVPVPDVPVMPRPALKPGAMPGSGGG